MGVAHLVKVTIISPRSEYEDVVKALAQFEDFHPLSEGTPGSFDPQIQEMTVKAVQLFAQADQAVKDLNLPLMPGQIDIVFRGAKIPRSDFDAGSWTELLNEAEQKLSPIVEEVRGRMAVLQKAQKDESSSETLISALKIVSGFSSDIGGLPKLHMLKALVTVVEKERVAEFSNSVPEAIFLTQPVSKEYVLVLVAVTKTDESKLEKALKLLDLKPLVLPPEMSQNPAEAFRELTKEHELAVAAIEKAQSEMAEIKARQGAVLLAVRELADVARKMLDEARVSGDMKRLAVISGYIPAKQEKKMRETFGRWIVQVDEVDHESGVQVPTLMENPPGPRTFGLVTKEQGLPGGSEVDPTPIVAFVFPIFFGMMFGDVGHGLILTFFMLLVRERSTGNMRQWANIFLVAGISSTIFGIVFGEFFELSFQKFVPIPPVIEIIHRVAGAPDTFDMSGIYRVMEIAILIGIAHLITALSLNIYQGTREHDWTEVFLEKIPVLTMYIGGVMYGLAFIGVGFSFNVLASSAPAPLFSQLSINVPNNVLGLISLIVLIPSMLVLLAGKSVAAAMGKIKGGSAMGLLANGGLEVFERISQFLSNTISYVRLAVMLLVHAALLLIINLMEPWSHPALIVPWVLLNLLILSFEAFVVYVQDLRLHLYEFFTKFFLGTGTPFRKIFPDRARVRINWH